MKKGTKIVLGVIGGVAVGGTAGYLIATTRYARKALQSINESDWRLPDPSFAVELAETPEQFALLDELVCECGAPILQAATPETTIGEAMDAIQACMAKQLYPTFQWPPVSGDHSSVHQLWSDLGLIARRAVVESEICPVPVPSPTNIPIPLPTP